MARAKTPPWNEKAAGKYKSGNEGRHHPGLHLAGAYDKTASNYFRPKPEPDQAHGTS